MEKMKIVGKRFEDEDWEDPSLGGWLLFYIVCQIFSILMSVWMVIQLPSLPLILVWVMFLAEALPIYSVISLILRWRNAIFLTLSAIIITLVSNVANLFAGIVSGQFAQNGAFFIGSIIAGIAWLIYFLKSKHVSVRFPKEDRKTFWFDGVAVAVTGGITLLACLLIILGAGNANVNHSQDINNEKIVKYLPQLRSLQSDGFRLENLLNTDKEWIALMQFKSPGDTDKKMLERFSDFGFRSRIRNLLTDEAPLFMQAVAEDNADFRVAVYIHNPGDGIEIVFPNEEIREMLKMGPAYPATDSKLTDEDIENLITEVESMWPKLSLESARLEKKTLNEGILTYTYIVDESKESVAEANEYVGAYVGMCCNILVTLAEKGNETARRFSKADLEIRVVIKGSRTGFTKRYDMMHTSELDINQ